MKKIIYTVLICLLMAGCAGPRPVMPTMDLPPEPKKPQIKSVIVPYQGNFLVGYPMNDSLALLEYLLKKDSYEEKLWFRIETMNQIMRVK